MTIGPSNPAKTTIATMKNATIDATMGNLLEVCMVERLYSADKWNRAGPDQSRIVLILDTQDPIPHFLTQSLLISYPRPDKVRAVPVERSNQP